MIFLFKNRRYKSFSFQMLLVSRLCRFLIQLKRNDIVRFYPPSNCPFNTTRFPQNGQVVAPVVLSAVISPPQDSQIYVTKVLSFVLFSVCPAFFVLIRLRFIQCFIFFHRNLCITVRTFHLLGSTVEFHRSSTGRTFIFFYSRHISPLSESHPIVILKKMVCRSLYRISHDLQLHSCKSSSPVPVASDFRNSYRTFLHSKCHSCKSSFRSAAVQTVPVQPSVLPVLPADVFSAPWL